MLLAVSALRFSCVGAGHEVMPLALKLKLVSHGLAFLPQNIILPQIIMSPGSSDLFS
jgi:hypothetical protein